MHSKYSTGSPEFDRYLGGVRAGDSLLIFQTNARESQPLLRILLDHIRQEDLSLFYLNLTGSRDFLISGIRCRNMQPPGPTRNRRSGLQRWITCRLKELKPGEVFLFDDLADWKDALGGEEALVRVFSIVSLAVQKKKGFLITTALRSAFEKPTLASLKESSSICLDLSSHGGDLLLMPLNLRGRYFSGPASPFGFRFSGKGGGKKRRFIPVQDFESLHGEKIRTEFFNRETIASLIIDGPLQHAPFGMLIADLEGSFKATNDHLRKMLGTPASDQELRVPISFINPEQKWPFLRFIARARKSRNATIDLNAVSPEGKPVPLRVRSMPVEGGLTLFLVEENRANDEVNRKLGELQQEVGFLFGENPVPLCFADRKKISAANAAFARLHGAASGWSGTALLSSCFPQKTLKQLREGMEGALSTGERMTVRGHLLRVDGSELPARISIAPAGGGRDGQSTLTVEDVSEFTSRIVALEENDTRFRTIAEQISRPVALLQGKEIVYCNPQCVELLGPGEAEKFRGRSIADFVPAEERDGFDAAFTKFLASRQAVQQVDATIVKPEGHLLGVRLTLRKIQGVPDAGILLELEDVTERRREEKRVSGVHAGTERIKTILEAATAGLEFEKLVHVALDRSLEVLGWSGGALFVLDAAAKSLTSVYARHIPKKLLDKIFLLPSAEGLGGYVSKTLESHVFSLDKYPSYLPFRTLFREHRIRQISLIPLVHGEAPIGFILGISIDERKADALSLETLTTLGRQLGNAMVNARKLAAVRESEHRLHTVVDSLSGIVYMSGPDGTILTIDAAVSGILGYTPREFDRNRSLFLSLIHEEDKKIYLGRVTGSEGLGSGFVREYRMRPKAKAVFRWMRDSVSVMRDQDGKVAGFTGILSDVTEDREKFRTVMTEHAILRTVQDALPDGIVVFDDGAACVDWNPTMELITGTARTAAVGKNAKDLAPLPASLGPDGFQLAVAARKPSRLGLVESSAHPGTWYESFLVPVAMQDPVFSYATQT